MKRTVALFASSRRDGNTGRLMDRVADELGIEVIDLEEKNISGYDYEHKNRNDDFEQLFDYVMEFDQIIFASPIYWYAVSPPMKIFLDRISDYLVIPELLQKGRQLRGKAVYVVCTSVCPEIDSAYLEAYEKTFRYLGLKLRAYLHANCRDGYRPARYESDVRAFIVTVGSESF